MNAQPVKPAVAEPTGRRIFASGAVRHIERDRRIEIRYVPDEPQQIRIERREGAVRA